MLTTRKSSLILLASVLVIFSTPILNYQAQGWANEYIEITVHTGIWRCGEYCGSAVTVSTFINTNDHFVTFHTGAGSDGHDDGHGSSIVYRRTDIVVSESWATTCSGDECNTA